MEFNWWVDQRFVGLRNSLVLKLHMKQNWVEKLSYYRSTIVEHYPGLSGFRSVELACSYIYIYIYIYITKLFTYIAKLFYSISFHLDFNTELFRRPTKRWPTQQLNSMHTEVSCFDGDAQVVFGKHFADSFFNLFDFFFLGGGWSGTAKPSSLTQSHWSSTELSIYFVNGYCIKLTISPRCMWFPKRVTDHFGNNFNSFLFEINFTLPLNSTVWFTFVAHISNFLANRCSWPPA